MSQSEVKQVEDRTSAEILKIAIQCANFDGSDFAYKQVITVLSDNASEITNFGWVFNDGSDLTRRTVLTTLMLHLMKKWDDYGALDSEGYHVYDKVIQYVDEGIEINNWDKYYNPNYWQLFGGTGDEVYDAHFPDRDKAAQELGTHLKRLYQVLTKEIKEKYRV